MSSLPARPMENTHFPGSFQNGFSGLPSIWKRRILVDIGVSQQLKIQEIQGTYGLAATPIEQNTTNELWLTSVTIFASTFNPCTFGELPSNAWSRFT